MNRDRLGRLLAPPRAGIRPLFRGALALGATLVAGLHLRLLLQRLVDDSIGEPAVLLRWLGALVLLAGAFYSRPRGFSLTQGRSGLVFWLLVLLLHVGASPIALPDADAQHLLLVLPWGLAAGLALASTGRRTVRPMRAARDPRVRRSTPDAPPPRCSAGAAPDRFSPRPPPLGSAA